MSVSHLPKHIAVVMDGNGRWAKARFLPRIAGHKAGVKAVKLLIEQCVKHGIEALTLFAFSSENWQRPEEEVQALMEIFFEQLEKELPMFQKYSIQVRIIGDREKFSVKLQERINETEQLTSAHHKLVLSIAASYGGRWDIVQAAKKIAQAVESKALNFKDLNEEKFGHYVSLSDLPEPDLFIRTSGEQRISNYLLWQMAYTELFFINDHWPDFSEQHFKKALDFFSQRDRKFGKVKI